MSMDRRATTPEAKRAIVERLLAAWLQVPEQRLGQLISNAALPADPFVIEDNDLAEMIEHFAYPRRTERAATGDGGARKG